MVIFEGLNNNYFVDENLKRIFEILFLRFTCILPKFLWNIIWWRINLRIKISQGVNSAVKCVKFMSLEIYYVHMVVFERKGIHMMYCCSIAMLWKWSMTNMFNAKQDKVVLIEHWGRKATYKCDMMLYLEDWCVNCSDNIRRHRKFLVYLKVFTRQ